MSDLFHPLIKALHEAKAKGEHPCTWRLSPGFEMQLKASRDAHQFTTFSFGGSDRSTLLGVPYMIDRLIDCDFTLDARRPTAPLPLPSTGDRGMTVEDFRLMMDLTRKADCLFCVRAGDETGIAVGLDSARGVAILRDGRELPLDRLEFSDLTVEALIGKPAPAS